MRCFVNNTGSISVVYFLCLFFLLCNFEIFIKLKTIIDLKLRVALGLKFGIRWGLRKILAQDVFIKIFRNININIFRISICLLNIIYH